MTDSLANWNPPAPLVASPRGGSAFRKHKRRLWAEMFANTTAQILAGAYGFAVGGPIGLGVVVALSAAVEWGWMARRNRKLRLELAKRIGDDDGEFVGLCTSEAALHKFSLDANDDVAFLAIRNELLVLRTEEATVEIPREEIRDVELVKVRGTLRTFVIRIELSSEETDAEIVINSRDADSARGKRRATEKLYRALVDWHFEDKLAWHARHR